MRSTHTIVGILAIAVAVFLGVWFIKDRLPDGDQSVSAPTTSTLGSHPASDEPRMEVPDQDESSGLAETHSATRSDAMKRVIQFLDGEEIEVTFRSAPSVEQQLGNVQLDDLHSLMSLAEDGNGSAAFAVFNLQTQCANAPQTAEALELAVNELYETFRIPDPTVESGMRNFGSDTDIGAIEQQMREQFARCQAIHVADLAPPESYLEMAAETGTYPATLQYAQNLRQAGDDRAVQYYEMAWNSGDVNAAIALGKMYRQGVGGNDPDRLKAYAYTYVGTQLANAFFQGMSGDVINEVREQVEERSEAMLADFFPAEAEAATPLAKSILADNLHCCVY